MPRPMKTFAWLFAPALLLSVSPAQGGTKTDAEVKQELIRQSIAHYPGNCPCPYNLDRAGRRCGARSAYSRPGGYTPLCFESDVAQSMVEEHRQKQRPATADREVSAERARDHVGEKATVCGTVASATYASSSRGQPTFLNLEKPYPGQVFTVVIWGRDRASFGAPEVTWRGKRVCASGLVESYRGTPQIIVHSTEQLRAGR
jgi:hypothetical protein